MGTIQDKLNLTLKNKNSIKEALRDSGVEVSDTEPFSSYANKIKELTGLDTSDATATSTDLIVDTTAYVKGKKITGELKLSNYSEDETIGARITEEGKVKTYNSGDTHIITIAEKAPERIAYEKDTFVSTGVTYDIMSNAIGLTPDKIKSGEKIMDIEGIFTSDADATAEDIAEGKIAYVNGEKVEGVAIIGNNANIQDDWSGASIIYQYITRLENVNLQGKSSAANLLKDCKRLEYVKFSNTENVTNVMSLCNHCEKLTEIVGLDTKKATNLNSAFNYCRELVELPQIDTSSCTMMSSLFTNDIKLVTIPELDASNCYSITYTFQYCTSLTNFGGLKNIGKAYTQQEENYSNYTLDLSHSKQLTHESLMNVINNLYDLNLTYDVANGGTLYTQSLVLSAESKALLSEEEIAIATNKGWTVS